MTTRNEGEPIKIEDLLQQGEKSLGTYISVGPVADWAKSSRYSIGVGPTVKELQEEYRDQGIATRVIEGFHNDSIGNTWDLVIQTNQQVDK